MTKFQKEQVRRLRSEGMGYSKIATCMGVSENTIKSYCKRNNLRRVVPAPELEVQNKEKETVSICKNCGKTIEQLPGQKPRKFCTDACRKQWWNSHIDLVSKRAIYRLECAGCGNPFDSYGNKERKYCSHSCYINHRFSKKV